MYFVYLFFSSTTGIFLMLLNAAINAIIASIINKILLKPYLLSAHKYVTIAFIKLESCDYLVYAACPRYPKNIC